MHLRQRLFPVLRILILIAVAGAPGAAAEAEEGVPLPAEPTLRDCLTYSALHNPGLKAAFHRWQAALRKAEQAGTPPDPRVTWSYYFREVETRVGPQRQAVKLSQTFPWFGKLGRRSAAAAREAEALYEEFQGEKLRLHADLTRAYSDYYYLGRALAVARDNVRLLEQLERLVRTRYKTAAASHPDLIRLQVEIGKLTDRVTALGAMQPAAAAKLDAALGRLDSSPALPWPRALSFRPVRAAEAALLAWLDESNPRVRALDARAAAEKERLALARKQYYPDVTVSGTWIDTGKRTGAVTPPDNGRDPVIAAVTLNLPIWRGSLAAGVRGARRRRDAVVRRRQQARLALGAALKAALFEVQDAERKLDLYRKALIPKARESLKAIQTGFMAGSSNFNDLIEVQRMLLEFELAAERALADHARWRATLEQTVGRPVPAADTGG